MPPRRSELVDRGLIYDVGVNDGADFAYYLSLGFRVLGIEANPALANRLKDRFSREIEEQRYILLNVGIAATEEQLDFWVSDVSEWSSFNREIASRNNTPHRAVSVPTRRFASVAGNSELRSIARLILKAMTGCASPN